MKKVLVIAGPTAAGKSAYAVAMAHRLNGIVISGDSIQVYRGFDIGSGKVTEAEKEGIPHALIDIRSHDEHYSAADFQKEARKVIDTAPYFPIICGGTGLYLKACLYDYDFAAEEVHEDPELEQYASEELYERLRQTDPAQAEKIHPHNRRRIIRALTIQAHTGRKMSEINASQRHEPVYDIWIAGCTMARDVLYARINQRVEKMFEAGLEAEVEGLLKQGCTFDDQPMQGIGYQEWQGYFQGELTLAEVKELIQKNSRHFAKRQYTWLRHQLPVHWFDITNQEDTERMTGEILAWRNDESKED
jgi:tRNA dimethylallyltransferase